MSAVKLYRTQYQPTLEHKKIFWGVLHGMLRGITDDHDLEFLGKVRRMVNAVPGTVGSWDYKHDRNGKFLQKFHVMIGVGFDAWEPDAPRTKRHFKGQPITKNIERFRHDVTVMAGHFDVSYNLDGTLNLTAKSIAFANMEEDEFEKVYSSVAQVLLDNILRNYTRADLDDVVAQLIEFT